MPTVDVEGVVEYWDDDGRLHRDGDLPAYIRPSGTRMWWRHGKPHRDDDQPATVYADGSCVWYTNGVLHRDFDMPAYVGDHYEWWVRGRRASRGLEKI